MCSSTFPTQYVDIFVDELLLYIIKRLPIHQLCTSILLYPLQPSLLTLHQRVNMFYHFHYKFNCLLYKLVCVHVHCVSSLLQMAACIKQIRFHEWTIEHCNALQLLVHPHTDAHSPSINSACVCIVLVIILYLELM